ncbi:Hypothetical predicted protein [Xyrichtys novacula]|uniref:Uncharacterized protein n=1 Tax=Xyrichtys novacula TaxID=13765 RepID=A0AAV1H6X6_XYRNO|nr:Hypothetical predicted protein [Xyrichtys novacula]
MVRTEAHCPPTKAELSLTYLPEEEEEEEKKRKRRGLQFADTWLSSDASTEVISHSNRSRAAQTGSSPGFSTLDSDAPRLSLSLTPPRIRRRARRARAPISDPPGQDMLLSCLCSPTGRDGL